MHKSTSERSKEKSLTSVHTTIGAISFNLMEVVVKEKYGSDYEETTEESEDEDEDEEAELVTPQVDAQILRVMTAIKSKDPKVYEDRTDFFSEQQMEEAKRKWQEKMAKKKREKPILLKDYHRKLLLEDGGFIEEEKEVVEKTHAQEQEELKSGLKVLPTNYLTCIKSIIESYKRCV